MTGITFHHFMVIFNISPPPPPPAVFHRPPPPPPPFRNCKLIRGDAKKIVSSDVGTSEVTILGHPPPRFSPNNCNLQFLRPLPIIKVKGVGIFFFFPRTFFSRRVWLELFYWAASRHVPFIYRRLRMCRETGPSPSHCFLGAGWDTAGGWGEGGFGQHLTGKGLVTVCDGTRDAVKFQETGRIGGHSCMGDIKFVKGEPPGSFPCNMPPPISVEDHPSVWKRSHFFQKMSSQRLDGRPHFLRTLQEKFDPQFVNGFQETDLAGHPCRSKLRSEESVFRTLPWEQGVSNQKFVSNRLDTNNKIIRIIWLEISCWERARHRAGHVVFLADLSSCVSTIFATLKSVTLCVRVYLG